MKSSENYRRLAGECLRIAQDTRNPVDRALLIAMADSWIRLAEQVEARCSEAENGAKRQK